MQAIQTDVVDVQAKYVLTDMIYCATQGSRVLTAKQKERMNIGIELLRDWDYSFDSDSTSASVFAVWEYAIGYYLHETTISSPKIRMGITNNVPSFSFVCKSIKGWADAHKDSNERTKQEFCLLTELGS
jgi:acyl-homoserine lactone acylase PvdQ